MSQGSLSPKIWFLGQKVCPLARGQTDTKVTTVGTLSGFQEFFLQPIIKDRPNTSIPKCFLSSLIYTANWICVNMEQY